MPQHQGFCGIVHCRWSFVIRPSSLGLPPFTCACASDKTSNNGPRTRDQGRILPLRPPKRLAYSPPRTTKPSVQGCVMWIGKLFRTRWGIALLGLLVVAGVAGWWQRERLVAWYYLE